MSKQEILWKHKAHHDHLFLGYRNNKIFHNKVERNKWKSKIHSIKDGDGGIEDDLIDIGKEFLK